MLIEEWLEEHKRIDKSDEIVRLKTVNPRMTMSEIGKLVNKHPTTVKRTLNKYGIDTKKTDAYSQYRVKILQGLQEQIVSNINIPEKAEKASIKDLAVALSILIDKERLIDNKSTQNISLVHIINELDKEDMAAKEDIENNG